MDKSIRIQPWHHTHNARWNGQQFAVYAEDEPGPSPKIRRFYELDHETPSWTQDLSTNALRRVGADPNKLTDHGIIFEVARPTVFAAR